MKKTHLFFGIVLCLIVSCSNSNSIIKEEPVPLSNKEKIKKLYVEKIIPLFKEYTEATIPTTFKIDENDLSINAGAAFGYVEISKGLVDYNKEYIQLFVIAHEVAHIVTLNQAKKFNLGNSIPRGSLTNEYKKAEYLADLIAIHLINTQLNEQLNLVVNDFSVLSNLLGTKSFTHPSNIERIKEMKSYVNESLQQNPSIIFKKKFEEIWKMD